MGRVIPVLVNLQPPGHEVLLQCSIGNRAYASRVAGILASLRPESGLADTEILRSKHPVDWRFGALGSLGRICFRQVQGGGAKCCKYWFHPDHIIWLRLLAACAQTPRLDPSENQAVTGCQTRPECAAGPQSALGRPLPVTAACCDLNLVVQVNVDAAIASAFLLDLADSHLTDFAR